MASAPASGSEELYRERLVRLEQTLAAEQLRRSEVEGLLASLREVASAQSLADADQAIVTSLATVFAYTTAALLVRTRDGAFAVSTSMGPDLGNLRVGPSRLLERVARGQPTALFDISSTPELADYHTATGAYSALLIPLVTSTRCAILLGAHPERAAFSTHQVDLARGFMRTAIPVLDSQDAREHEHLARLAEARATALADTNLELQQQLTTIAAQRAKILRLSAPVLHVGPQTIAVPVIGRGDDLALTTIGERVLATVARHNIKVAILDLTGLEQLDHSAINLFTVLASAVRLLGGQCLLSGMQPAAAASFAADRSASLKLRCFPTLAAALAASRSS